MRTLMARLWPDRIFAQLIMVIVGILLTMVAIMALVLRQTDGVRIQTMLPYIDGQVSLAVGLLKQAAPGDRDRILADIAALDLDFRLVKTTDKDLAQLEKGTPQDSPPPWIFAPQGVEYWIERATGIDPEQGTRAYIRLDDSTLLLAIFPPNPPNPANVKVFLLVTLVLLAGATSLWATQTITGPLRRLAEAAAEPIRPGSNGHFLARGPREVRRLADALNAMQARISGLIDRRTRFLAAVSHDLRTPLTRMRLRLALDGENPGKPGLRADIDLMERLVEGTLLYLRSGETGEMAVEADLASLAQTIEDNYADMGSTLTVTCPPGLTAIVRPSELERAICNLIDNALRHGQTVGLEIRAEGDRIVIDTVDDGPGLGAADRARLLEPYSHADSARTLPKNGRNGLGLSIASAICAAHGGELALIDRQPHGLIARISIPARPAA